MPLAYGCLDLPGNQEKGPSAQRRMKQAKGSQCPAGGIPVVLIMQPVPSGNLT